MAGAPRQRLRATGWKLGVAALVMFGFGFALVPLYDVYCRLTGQNELGTRTAASGALIDRSRTVTLVFDANAHDLPGLFRPLQASLRVHPGETVRVDYEASNPLAVAVTGQAIVSYGPRDAGRYVAKLDCFCFTRQQLAAGETRRLPVVFMIDPALPGDVHTITLSYTFFRVEGTAPERLAGLARRDGA